MISSRIRKRTFIFKIETLLKRGALYPGVEKIVGKPDFILLTRKWIGSTDMYSGEVRVHMIGTTHPSPMQNVFEADPLTEGVCQYFSRNLFLDGLNLKDQLIKADTPGGFRDNVLRSHYREHLLDLMMFESDTFKCWDVTDQCFKPVPQEILEECINKNRLHDNISSFF